METSISAALMLNNQERGVAQPQEIPAVASVVIQLPKWPGLGPGDLELVRK
jgi:hypothetical protein